MTHMCVACSIDSMALYCYESDKITSTILTIAKTEMDKDLTR